MRGTYWKVKEGIQELVYWELVSRPGDKRGQGWEIGQEKCENSGVVLLWRLPIWDYNVVMRGRSKPQKFISSGT